MTETSAANEQIFEEEKLTPLMTIDAATRLAFERYRDLIHLKRANLAPVDWSANTENPSGVISISHALWMCEWMLNPKTDHFSIDKKSRWLGFVQAILVFHGLTTVEAERNITRPWFNPSRPWTKEST